MINDESTGLYYLNARYYDPATSRMLTQDTYRGDKLEPDTLHLYAYCSNNPINFVDPSGHSPVSGIKQETRHDSNISMILYIHYSRCYVKKYGYNFYRITKGYAKVTKCAEQGFRKLKMTIRCAGEYIDDPYSDNPKLTGRFYDKSKLTEIKHPKRDKKYKAESPSKYYHMRNYETNMYALRLSVSIQWKHGKWYTSKFVMNI